ncbi:hypothetical protein B484DRAFT_435632 [Ochromonadaceae sp. CCMP2298]|nr:hypothetical protein B484DRAFT_435632 [Ochromonadaceae sp. CCMP2298]
MGAKSEIYQGAWSALNAWLETKLAKQKGGGISGLGCFCWELKKKAGVVHCRPMFVMSDAFVKNFRIKRERIHKLPETTPIEEVNFSLLAIKFSKNLTKDMVFSGLRDTVKKIGDFIDRGYEVDIAFTFGRLQAKERRVKFTFDQTRLQQILPENIPQGVLAFGKAPANLFEEEEGEEAAEMTYRGSEVEADVNPSETARRDSSEPSLLTLEDGPATDLSARVKPLIPQLPLRTATADTRTVSPDDAYAYDDSVSEMDMPEDLQTLLETLANKGNKASKDVFRNQAKTRVLGQAYMRCLNKLENEAQADDQTTLEAKHLLDEWRHKTQVAREAKHDHMSILRESLHSQMQHNEAKEALRLDEKKDTIMRFILPDSAGQGRNVVLKEQLDGEGKVVVTRHKAISQILEEQIAKNVSQKEQTRQDSLSNERDYLNRLKMEIDYHNAVSRTSHLEKQRTLLESWERDGHVKNLKKLQAFGVAPVRDYIDRNLNADPLASSSGPLNYTSTLPAAGAGQNTFATTLMNTFAAATAPAPAPGQTLAGKLNKSIGYDPRRGKVEW